MVYSGRRPGVFEGAIAIFVVFLHRRAQQELATG